MGNFWNSYRQAERRVSLQSAASAANPQLQFLAIHSSSRYFTSTIIISINF
jgi:hypothetical protein